MTHTSGDGQMIAAAVRDLEAQWGEVSRSWNDQVAADFRRLHLAPIAETLHEYARALDGLMEALEDAERAGR
jgi:uncharacterized protein YukE